jgi:hypothetical protein
MVEKKDSHQPTAAVKWTVRLNLIKKPGIQEKNPYF